MVYVKKLQALCLMLFTALVPAGAAAAAEYRDLPLTVELVESGITIVDIRTEWEWRQTGVVPDTVLLTFFRRDRSYDLDGFIAALNRHVQPQQEFAILCRRGNRSAVLAAMLAERGYSSIINLSGGIRAAAKNGVPLVPYAARK